MPFRNGSSSLPRPCVYRTLITRYCITYQQCESRYPDLDTVKTDPQNVKRDRLMVFAGTLKGSHMAKVARRRLKSQFAEYNQRMMAAREKVMEILLKSNAPGELHEEGLALWVEMKDRHHPDEFVDVSARAVFGRCDVMVHANAFRAHQMYRSSPRG